MPLSFFEIYSTVNFRKNPKGWNYVPLTCLLCYIDVSMADWLVGVSNWGRETVARENLEKKSFVCYFPQFREREFINGQKTWVQKYLFGRYFFVEFADHWKDLFKTNGVFGILMNQGEPSQLNESVVKEIKQREDSNGFIVIEKKLDRYWFKKGDLVRVNRGSLIGYEGMFDRGYGGDRVKVLFDFFGRKSLVILRNDEITKSSERGRSHRKRLLNRQRRLPTSIALNA